MTSAARREAYAAWRITPDNPRGEAIPLEIPAHMPTGLELARELATKCQHKDHFVVRVNDLVTNKSAISFYAIRRQSAPRWTRDPRTGESVCIAALYPVLLFSMAVDAFVPIEPWKWAPGGDVIGADGLVITA